MSACPLVDCHTHTSFSDGHASFEDNVRAAAAAGCQVMVSTDHLTLPASMDATLSSSGKNTGIFEPDWVSHPTTPTPPIHPGGTA